MTTTELRMHCPNCEFPAKGRWIDPETEDVVLPGRISAESIGAMILGATLYQANPGKVGSVLGVLCFPLIASAFGILASMFGVLAVKKNPGEAQD